MASRVLEYHPQKSEVEEIRELLEERIQAVRRRDIAGATEASASDLVLFDVVDPLQATGVVSQRKRLAEWLSSVEGPVGFEICQLRVSAAEGIGYSYGLFHVSAATKTGKLDMYWRWTACYEKRDGAWKVVHEHNSVPFNVSSGKPSLGLKP